MKKIEAGKTGDFLIIGISIFLTVIVIILTIQNLSLKSEITSLKRQIAFEQTLKIGDKIEPFVAKDAITGEVVDLNRYSEKGVLLIYLGLECKYCKEDIPLWLQIASTETIPIVAITTGAEIDNIEQYARDNHLPFPILVDDDKRIFDSLKIYGTPTKIYLSKELQVQHVWVGLTSQDSSASDLVALQEYWGIDRESLPVTNAVQIQ